MNLTFYISLNIGWTVAVRPHTYDLPNQFFLFDSSGLLVTGYIITKHGICYVQNPARFIKRCLFFLDIKRQNTVNLSRKLGDALCFKSITSLNLLDGGDLSIFMRLISHHGRHVPLRQSVYMAIALTRRSWHNVIKVVVQQGVLWDSKSLTYTESIL